MKKLVVLILSIVYLITSIGATIHLHYCMGKLVDWSIAARNSSECSNCGMIKVHNGTNDGCCKDEFHQIKNDKDQKLLQASQLTKPLMTETVYVLAVVLANSPSSQLTVHLPDNNVVPRSCPSLNITNCVFRI